MKIATLVFLISLSFTLHAQKSIFVRVFNLQGKKIDKGNIVAVTDTSLSLTQNSIVVVIPVTAIGSIKTKRSAGNNILVPAVVTASTLAILLAVTAQPDKMIFNYTAAEGAAGGAAIGLVLGGTVGALTALSKNSTTYSISGDPTKWKVFQASVTPNKNW